MVAKINPWSEAPAGTTHRHRQTGMFYSVNEAGQVSVYSKHGQWVASKVQATSAMLEPAPAKEEPVQDNAALLSSILRAKGLPEELISSLLDGAEVELIDLSDEEDEPTEEPEQSEEEIIENIVVEALMRMGVPKAEALNAIASVRDEEQDEEEEKSCDCPSCTGGSEAEQLNYVGQKLEAMLTALKAKFDLPFNVALVMQDIGFVNKAKPVMIDPSKISDKEMTHLTQFMNEGLAKTSAYAHLNEQSKNIIHEIVVGILHHGYSKGIVRL
ncbi:hypothetical protein pVco7_gp081 [Vibrio phage pVco-7]|uniref:Uncharacterized protein n=1 Tax=Vibrio phage pVco-5 TaxID=1965485 RepID=A0A1W6JUW8_9CAUD|nr:hypothetical protein KNT61_gp081 [Vibrio phage pVco-5]ARM71069.1 hypothetical protein pVco5_081 [Vibrio phage pVco-5]